MADENKNTASVHRVIAPLMEAIGHVAHHWARLEHEINQVIWILAGTSAAYGACITAQIPSIVPRLRALTALAQNNGVSTAVIKDLNRFSGKADKLSRRRNRTIHDPWFFREYRAGLRSYVEFGRLEVTADRRLTYEIKPQSRKAVLDIAHDIIAAHKEFTLLRDRIFGELREQIELRLGKRIEEALDFPGPDTAP
jgi:hypothetical protein